jgi:hypothetical protein
LTKQTTAKITAPEMYYTPKIRFDYAKNGVVGTNLLRVTHDYNATTSKWMERTEYEMLGNADQRIRKSLEKFVAEPGDVYNESTGKFTSITNPFNLDKNEVAEYCSTGNDENCKSFKVMKNAAGKPAFFVVVDGVGQDVYEKIEKAVARFNEIDPTVINLISDRNGVNCVAYDRVGVQGGLFAKYPAWGATYDSYNCGNTVFINKNNAAVKQEGRAGVEMAMYIMFVESRACRYRQLTEVMTQKETINDSLSSKQGIVNVEADKYRLIIKYATEKWLPSNKITRFEYGTFMGNAEAALKAYDPSYVLTWDFSFDSPYFIPEK